MININTSPAQSPTDDPRRASEGTPAVSVIHPPVRATRFVRRMRGGAQAHLLEADDGHFYVTKFRDNPQHRRVLVNEWIVSALFRHLGILTPTTAIIALNDTFLALNPEIYIQLSSRRQSVRTGLHFGSRYPGNPFRHIVYDFLPDPLITKANNLDDFVGTYIVDKWVANTDARQCVFVRDSFDRSRFLAFMIDNGNAFGGRDWSFYDSPIQNYYFRPIVYRAVSTRDCEKWLTLINAMPEEVLHAALREVPIDWLSDDGGAIERLLDNLLRRRQRLPVLLDGLLR